MVQRLFNELYQRAIKGLLVQLTRLALALINVSLSIVRLTIFLQAPTPHLSYIPLATDAALKQQLHVLASSSNMNGGCHRSAIYPHARLIYAQTN